MDFRISALLAEPFTRFFAMADADLLRHGTRRVLVVAGDAPPMQPCRVSLCDAEPGEVSILLTYPHHGQQAAARIWSRFTRTVQGEYAPCPD